MQSVFIKGVTVLKNWRFSTYRGFEVTVLYFFVGAYISEQSTNCGFKIYCLLNIIRIYISQLML